LFLLVSGQIIYTKQISINKIDITNFGEILRLNYNPIELEQIILNEETPIEIPNENFLRYGYISLVYSINYYIFTRKNISIREEINKKFNKFNSEFNNISAKNESVEVGDANVGDANVGDANVGDANVGDANVIENKISNIIFDNIEGSIKDMKLDTTDTDNLIKIFNIAFLKEKNTAKKIFNDLFNSFHFSFDLVLRDKLLNLLSNNSTQEIKKIIKNIFKKLTIIVEKKRIDYVKFGKFIEMCEKKEIGDPKIKNYIGCKNGKLELTQFEYDYFYDRFIDEIMNNNIKKEIVLSNKLNGIKKYTYIW
jgi:hypothetical protein